MFLVVVVLLCTYKFQRAFDLIISLIYILCWKSRNMAHLECTFYCQPGPWCGTDNQNILTFFPITVRVAYFDERIVSFLVIFMSLVRVFLLGCARILKFSYKFADFSWVFSQNFCRMCHAAGQNVLRDSQLVHTITGFVLYVAIMISTTIQMNTTSTCNMGRITGRWYHSVDPIGRCSVQLTKSYLAMSSHLNIMQKTDALKLMWEMRQTVMTNLGFKIMVYKHWAN